MRAILPAFHYRQCLLQFAIAASAADDACTPPCSSFLRVCTFIFAFAAR
jgi:hypothetical protein